ncbi:unnamed protein product [Rotaria socialis]|uniref:Endothelin-converting enzyme 1 n=1 Tax=Rotaria socialis TaxID=392032 RepID=A0A820PXT7_9BILA|nr:unnamed protein product [Rotaria socialis]CAF3367245.1 unnamed protein product [Rotaria socialis]CAF3651200.1 unnamed protein product [Rotaria socialis]CAF4313905.1 unnamed protein product [Rotaria socialis]CAF4411846.1 unnamed protein product [Rotaria socialis]
MSRYKHFNDELSAADINETDALPELDVDEPHQLEFKLQLRNYASNAVPSTASYNLNHMKVYFSKRTRLERCLILTNFIVLFVAFCIFLSCFYRHHDKQEPEKLCLTPICIQLSSSIYSGLNQTINPCDDFYEFVCGRWIKTNIIPKGHSGWSTTKELSRKNLIILKSILEQTSIKNSLSAFTAEQEAIKFYQSCMNISEIEQQQARPLERFLKENFNLTINDWMNIDQNKTWERLFVSLTKILSTKYGFSYLLPISIGPDDKNSTWNVIHINQPQLGLDNRDYYLNSSLNNRSDPETDTRNKIIRDTYINVASELLQLLGFEKNQSMKRIYDIMQFEIELAKISLPMEVLQKPNETYFLMTLKQLQEQYQPIGLDVYSFLNEMLNINVSSPIKLTENDQIIVLSLGLMLNVSSLLKDYLLTPEKSYIVIDHIVFSLIFDLSSHLSLAFEKLTLPLFKELYGMESLPDRWEYCVRETDAAFGYGLGALYIKAVFGEEDRKKANELIKNIRQTFDENLNQLQWIDEQSRIEAKRKISKITEKVGYPDFLDNKTKLNERYTGYSMIENEYFDNGIKVLERERRRSLLKFRQKVDLTDWSMTPRTVNAYYTPSANEIVFPAGILQPPFFHKDLPISINYGAIGTVIGHEITHGFDDQGREYDSDGNMRAWWTKSALDKFEERTKCFVQQYSSFALDGQNENGQRTLSENIADNGGLKLSYHTYQKHKQRTVNSGNNLPLPGLSYNNDQLFFIAFAHSWCNLETPNAMHYDLTNDPHSPPRSRIMGTIANSLEFAQTFSCQSKSNMNPSNKCHLW